MVVAVGQTYRNGVQVVAVAPAPQEQMAHQLKLVLVVTASVHQLQDHL
jgi:hypothetical protein